jgi:hypothetical protein
MKILSSTIIGYCAEDFDTHKLREISDGDFEFFYTTALRRPWTGTLTIKDRLQKLSMKAWTVLAVRLNAALLRITSESRTNQRYRSVQNKRECENKEGQIKRV